MTGVPFSLLATTVSEATESSIFARDIVFKFKNIEEFESSLKLALEKLYNLIELELETKTFVYQTENNKKKRESLDIHWRTFTNSFYAGISIFNDDGYANLLETAIVNNLTKKG